MSERRQAFRPDPIEVELEKDGRLISVGPVPWEQRNDIGNEIVKQHTNELNEAVRIFVAEDGTTPQLEARMANKLTDPFAIMHLALEPAEYEKVVDKKIYLNQITAILLAIVEVNELEHLKPLVDPNASTPGSFGGMISTLLPTEDDNTPQTGSGQNSSPGASPATSSETSPTPSLVESSTS